MKFDIGKSDLVTMFLLPTSIIINFDPQDNPFRSRESENLDFEVQSFSNKLD